MKRTYCWSKRIEERPPPNAIIGFSEVLTDRMFGELNELVVFVFQAQV
jgi:hypothetical protein